MATYAVSCQASVFRRIEAENPREAVRKLMEIIDRATSIPPAKQRREFPVRFACPADGFFGEEKVATFIVLPRTPALTWQADTIKVCQVDNGQFEPVLEVSWDAYPLSEEADG